MTLDKSHDVSAFEAKTHLSALLREAERGKSFVIRRRGKTVARLVPPDGDTGRPRRKDVLAAFRAIRRKISGTVNVRELIEKGRRF